jgi:putative spermidine/putrescine transport system substrate-binding protein
MKKKVVGSILILSMVLGLYGCGNSEAGTETDDSGSSAASQDSSETQTTTKPYEGETLVVQVWGGTYEETMREYAIPAFEEETGATVEVITGAAPLTQFATEGDAASADIVHIDSTEVVKGTEMDVLETIDKSKLSNANDLYEEAFIYDNAVVTNWGSYGICYRKDLVETPPTKWMDMWDSAYSGGKVGVMDVGMGGGLELADMVARIQGTDITDKDNWDNVFAKLEELKDNIGIYGNQHADVEALLQTGDIYMAIETNGRAISLMQEGLDVGFCAPEEGVPAMTSYVAMAKGSQNKDLAYEFMDILLSPEIQKQYAINNYYAPSNSTTEVPDDLKEFMPYGQEEISKLVYLDTAGLEPIKAEFVERWNQEFK